MSSKRSLTISVRELVEFALRTGDLAGGRDFVRPSRALEGTREHQRLQKSRPEGYQAEVAIEHAVEEEDFSLRIKGRIDGVLERDGEILLEEIKTTEGRAVSAPDPLHWAQLKIYGLIYLQKHPCETVALQLTYVDLMTRDVTTYREKLARIELAAFFAEVLSHYLVWLREQVRWWATRDQSIQSLAFPFPEYRAGQRALAVAAYRTIAGGGKLFAEAPTGIGKTISVLFPTVKALGESRVSKIFYLTAKTVGRIVAEKAINDMRAGGLRLRSLSLTAKEKLCVRDGQPCDVRTCPLAIGYYDRLKKALRDLFTSDSLTRNVIEEIAQRHQVCPSALSLDAAPWVDVIICDYNYAFDPQAYLRQFFLEGSDDYAFLIDEAHNLVDRGREMFSSDLVQQEFLELKQALGDQAPGVAKSLRSVSRAFTSVRNDFQSENELTSESSAVAKEFPSRLIPVLQRFLQEAENWLTLEEPVDFRQSLLELYFRVARFLRTAQDFDSNYVTLLRKARRQIELRLFCLDPSRLLHQALERSHAAVFFSATLRPIDYFRQTLGGDPQDRVLELPSPFPAENTRILIEDQIATTFKLRAATFDRVARSIAAFVETKGGNYLVYFPSYQYLNQVLDRFRGLSGGATVLVQTPQMSETQREAFMAAFHEERAQTLVGFAVMGGIFGEGIDLVGERLVGAAVVGVGLPQVCLERELIRAHFEEKNAAGFEYAYVFPGLNRVLQAAGRVIRSETDLGLILLIDSRFRQDQYRRLLPEWWNVINVGGEAELSKAGQDFWKSSTASISQAKS